MDWQANACLQNPSSSTGTARLLDIIFTRGDLTRAKGRLQEIPTSKNTLRTTLVDSILLRLICRWTVTKNQSIVAESPDTSTSTAGTMPPPYNVRQLYTLHCDSSFRLSDAETIAIASLTQWSVALSFTKRAALPVKGEDENESDDSIRKWMAVEHLWCCSILSCPTINELRAFQSCEAVTSRCICRQVYSKTDVTLPIITLLARMSSLVRFFIYFFSQPIDIPM